MDYFLARYYSSSQGRFTSPDEFTGGPDELFDFADDAADNPTFYADLTNPQSLNKYQYAYNNPLRYTDADGHEADDPAPHPDCCKQDSNSVPAPAPPLTIPPGQAQQMVDSASQLINYLDRAIFDPIVASGPVQTIRQAIGTSPEPTIAPVQIGPLVGTPPWPQSQPAPPPPPIQAKGAKKQKVKTATRTSGGVTPGKTISDKQAVERLRRGQDVLAPSRAKAKQLQKKASRGAVVDRPHRPGYRPHVHGRNRGGGHSFY